MAICCQQQRQANQKQITQWIQDTFPFYQSSKPDRSSIYSALTKPGIFKECGRQKGLSKPEITWGIENEVKLFNVDNLNTAKHKGQSKFDSPQKRQHLQQADLYPALSYTGFPYAGTTIPPADPQYHAYGSSSQSKIQVTSQTEDQSYNYSVNVTEDGFFEVTKSPSNSSTSHPPVTIYRISKGISTLKPPVRMKYLIALATLSQPDQKANLSQILNWIKRNIPYYEHNELSKATVSGALSSQFEKREVEDDQQFKDRKGKGKKQHFWKIKNISEFFSETDIFVESFSAARKESPYLEADYTTIPPPVMPPPANPPFHYPMGLYSYLGHGLSSDVSTGSSSGHYGFPSAITQNPIFLNQPTSTTIPVTAPPPYPYPARSSNSGQYSSERSDLNK